MKMARGLAVWTLTMALARVASAQEPGPPPDEPPPTIETPEDTTPPSQQPGPAAPMPPPGAAPAPAPPAEVNFGGAGVIVISDDVQLAVTQVSYDSQGVSTKRTQVELRPALDYFVLPNLSVGGQLIFGYTSIDVGSSNTNSKELGLLGRVGYTFAISPTTSIWPRIAFGYDQPSNQTSSAAGSNQQSISLQVYAPIVFQPVPHFFIGGGPIVSTQVISKVNDADAPKATIIGLQSTIGGYFSGPTLGGP